MWSCLCRSGPCLNIKIIFPGMEISIIKIRWSWPSYLYNRNSYSHKTISLVWWHYNAVNFLQNNHGRHPIARPPGWGMGCLLWIHPLIDILPQFLQGCVQYHVIFDCTRTALDCIETAWSYHSLAWIHRCPWCQLISNKVAWFWK